MPAASGTNRAPNQAAAYSDGRDRRLQAALTELVRGFYGTSNDRAVIVGAGASVEAGLPDGHALHEEIAKTNEAYRTVAGLLGEDRDVERVFRVLEQLAATRVQASASWDLLRALRVPSGKTAPVASHQAGACLEQIMRFLRQRLWFPTALPDVFGMDSPPKPYRYLGPLVRGQRGSTIVSLNYDNCLEEADPNAFTIVPKTVRVEVPDERADGTRIIKLHGSLNWKKIGDDIAIGGRPREGIDYEPGIIFGAGNKLRYYGPFLRLFQAFVECIRRSRVVMTIGYGFRDAHVNDVLRIWAEDAGGYDFDNAKQLVVCLGPNPNAQPPAFVQPWEKRDHLRVHYERGAASEVIRRVFTVTGDETVDV